MTADLSPTARSLLALEHIQNTPGITGEELAGRLGVSDRAARRYVGVLRDAGIPIASTSGRYGGYRIGRGLRLAPLMFDAAEALGLVMAVLQGWHGAANGDHPVATALGKIVRVLPSASAAPVEALRRVHAVNRSDAAAGPDPAIVAAVAQATESRRQLQVTYGRNSREMLLDPWAVVVRHGRWYVLCWSQNVNARRVLRLDRMDSVVTLAGTFAVPGDLDPAADLEEHLATGWTHEVEIRFTVPLATAERCVPRTLGRLSADGDDACLLRGSTDEPDWYAAQLAATLLPFSVLTSEEIRSEVSTLSHRLATAAEPVECQVERQNIDRGLTDEAERPTRGGL